MKKCKRQALKNGDKVFVKALPPFALFYASSSSIRQCVSMRNGFSGVTH